MNDLQQRAARIQLIIFDIDGVLTDGRLLLGDDGQEYKAFNSRDGLGIALLRDTGIEIAIITARQSEVVRKRMESLQVRHVYQGCEDKEPAYRRLLSTLALQPEQVAYVGDDVIDLPVMTQVGLAVAVADAHPFVKRHAHWITPSTGGHGAGRDVIEQVLAARGELDAKLRRYLR